MPQVAKEKGERWHGDEGKHWRRIVGLSARRANHLSGEVCQPVVYCAQILNHLSQEIEESAGKHHESNLANTWCIEREKSMARGADMMWRGHGCIGVGLGQVLLQHREESALL